MKKIVILIVAILSVSLLSGCVENATLPQNKKPDENIEKDMNLSTNTETPGNGSLNGTIFGSLNLSENGGAGTRTGDWCIPGSKIWVSLPTGEKEYTVVGLPVYKGRQICQAERLYENGKSTKYFSQDGDYVAMVSNASGKGSVYSEAKSEINSSG